MSRWIVLITHGTLDTHYCLAEEPKQPVSKLVGASYRLLVQVRQGLGCGAK